MSMEVSCILKYGTDVWGFDDNQLFEPDWFNYLFREKKDQTHFKESK